MYMYLFYEFTGVINLLLTMLERLVYLEPAACDLQAF